MDPRQELVDYLTRQLVGPAGGDDEVLDAPPDRQYLMGTLYPQQADLRRQLNRAADDPEAPGAEQDAPDVSPATDPVPDANSWLPASLGLSFYTDAVDVEVSCAAARYETRRNETGRGGAGTVSPSRRRHSPSALTGRTRSSSTAVRRSR